MPHVHWFRPRADWGRFGYCRCGMAKRRMFGGYGYALPGGRWYDASDIRWHREMISREEGRRSRLTP